MRATIHQLIAVSIFCAATTPSLSSVLAQSTASNIALDSATRINAANALVREGKTAEAIADYQQVPVADADREQLTYNLGVAEYRAGNIDAAKTYFTDASASSQASLAARSRYNLGNCFYSDAVKAAEQDKSAAIESLRQAIGHYRGSLSADPNLMDARANIELAGQLLKKLQEEQKQDQQKQDQQKQDQQKQDQQKQDQQKQDQQKQDQQKQDQQKQDQQKQDQQPKDQESQDQQSKDQPSEEQQQPPEQKQDAQPQDEQNSKSGESGSKEEEPEKNQESQQQSGEPQEPQPDKQGSNPKQEPSANKPKPQSNKQAQTAEQEPASESAAEEDKAGKEQAVPTGELTTAGELDASEKPNGQVGVADLNTDNGLMTKEEALKMLQAVRDRDMLRRLRQEQLERSRHIPTDRDW